jgi:hypothetical protein
MHWSSPVQPQPSMIPLRPQQRHLGPADRADRTRVEPPRFTPDDALAAPALQDPHSYLIEHRPQHARAVSMGLPRPRGLRARPEPGGVDDARLPLSHSADEIKLLLDLVPDRLWLGAGLEGCPRRCVADPVAPKTGERPTTGVKVPGWHERRGVHPERRPVGRERRTRGRRQARQAQVSLPRGWSRTRYGRRDGGRSAGSWRPSPGGSGRPKRTQSGILPTERLPSVSIFGNRG